MHRMKIGLIAAGVLLVSTLGIFVAVKSNLDGTANSDTEAQVDRAERLFQALARLEGFDFANLVSERARRPSALAISQQANETERRKLAFTEAEAINAVLEKDGRKADIVAVLDASGKLIARDLNPNAMYGDDLRAQFGAVDRVLHGEATKDIWTLQGRMTRVALAPVAKPDGTIVGALLIGNVISAKEAQARKDMLGTEIAYFHAGKVQTSSFLSEGEAAGQDGGKASALNAKLFQESKIADEALSTGRPQKTRMVIDGQDFAAVVSAIPGNLADKTSGVVLLASVTAAKAAVAGDAFLVLLLGGIGMLVALGATVLTAKRFITPLDHVELGVAEVINGNIDYTFDPVGPDFEGLSNSLNVMLARLLGRDDPNEDAVEEEEGEGRRWKAAQMIIEESDGSAPPGVNAVALANENEAAYYPRLFNEYAQALRQSGQPFEGLSVQVFTMKLRLAEGGLKQKWSCRLVRFVLLSGAAGPMFRGIKLS